MSYYKAPRFPTTNKIKIAAAVITVIIIIIVLSESIVIVEAGHRGVVLYLGAVENRVLGEGVHFITPFAEQVVQMEEEHKNSRQKRVQHQMTYKKCRLLLQ